MFKHLIKVSGILMILLASLGSLPVSAQNRTISGKVVDTAGDPVIGAAVTVVGNTRIGAATDLNGAFTLNVPAGANISVESIGYKTQTFAIGNQTNFSIVLEEDTEMLEETVVIGYGVQKKSDLTGAVASVRGDALQNQSTADAAAALQGKAPGVHVITNGSPGSGADIRVRGYSSNSGNIGPLYIVDGLQVSSIQYLDPSMIESIEILKDAASAAIYGAQAGNGVVLVTTKSGQEGKATVTYTGKATLQDFHKRSMMGREDLLKYLALEYGDDYVQNNLRDYDYSHPDYPGGVIDQDWVSAYIEPSWSHQHGISFSGGNRNGHFFTSINYVNQNGVVRGDKDVYKRLTAQVNADYQLFKWLQVGVNSSIEKYSTKSVSQRGYSSSFENMLLMDPCTPVYWKTVADMPTAFQEIYAAVQAGDPNTRPYRFLGDENGFFANTKYSDVEGSPLAKRDASDDSNDGFNINGTFFANLMPIKGLTITSRFGYRIAQNVSHSYTAPYYVGRGSEDNYSISANANTSFYYQWENFANYIFNIGKNNFTVMAGMSYRENNSDNVSASARGLDILTNYADNFHYLNYVTSDTAKATKSIGNLPGRSASLAYFGRIIWSYDNRYSLQANFRADASDTSKLPKNNRWGYFPSFSAGWTVSNEQFFKDNLDRNVFNFLKLRASWGRNGNINVLSGYRYTTSISPSGSWYQYQVDNPTNSFGSAPNMSGGLPNPNLHWEIAEQLDLGLDARFLNNRLTLGVDWFNKQTKDLLFSISTPPELGASTSTVNGGRVLNRGLEFELGWRDHIGDFNYSINANFSSLYNEVLELAARAARQTSDPASGTNYKVRTAFEPGYPVWYLLGYVYEGMDANGDPIIKDKNKDGEIASDDMEYIGQGTPKFTYGLNINLSWKGFDFAMYGAGLGGNVIMPVLHRTGFKNSMKCYLDLYESGQMPHPSKTVAADTPFWSSTGNLFKGDFFRIKQLQLGYTVPASLTRKAAISNLRFYVSLDDYFTFTKYPGLDPETASVNNSSGTGVDWGSYPTMQKIVLGINLTF
jgi:TonB-linked SusC/RagA family outer membrane protein